MLMVTAVGSSFFYTLKSLVERPGEIFSLLANTLPYSTHFYLSYFPFQWYCCHLLQTVVSKIRFRANAFFQPYSTVSETVKRSIILKPPRIFFLISFRKALSCLLSSNMPLDPQDSLRCGGHPLPRGSEIFRLKGLEGS